ncbi:hypothetical protein CWI75_09295 [Kineobactrum sediminis]|uniref:DUF3604 domain-containing protein n=1 Tax=Kineobactrum sediminis TaxID=1905677 RepID=A0A2N5Y309_9GAMM|nr:DUF3604 domain-containing protein [Kineobactrum sediminis]PLW82757.1 hypothetical protein CWI75_09295 [Kineobactrum sediminis]
MDKLTHSVSPYHILFFILLLLGGNTFASSEKREACADHQADRQAFFGDLHVHTRYSLDASTQGTRTTPAQAYLFARGQRIGIQPWDEEGEPGRTLQLRRPLDFAMVSDHAELIGEVNMCTNPQVAGYRSWQCRVYRAWPRGAFYLFNYMASMRASHLGMCGDEGERCLAAALAPWEEMQQASEDYYDRSADCSFTTFTGYEWTASEPGSGGNLHRNVVFRNAQVPTLPASYIDTPGETLLWDSLEKECNDAASGCEALVIPHNSNLSAGYMFSGLQADGTPIDADYAARRRRMEPLAEIMQHKGASECFFAPGITRDELCAFEQLALDNIAGFNNLPQPDTGFLRETWLEGIALQQELDINPFQFGVIGSTDTHLGAPGAVAEDDFPGHGGAGVPALKSVPPGLTDKLEYNPGGLAVLWAEENTRDALFAAMQRREAYGTSGPRIVTRLFAGWELDADLCAAPDQASRAYAAGVPMGGELGAAPEGAVLRLLVSAQRDSGTPDHPGMPLQKLQVIKGWIDDEGTLHQRVVDVAGDPEARGAVDTTTCETSGEGHAQLCAVWEDPAFNAQQSAFYYSRVVENPACRWSQRQCVAAGVDCTNKQTIGRGYEGCCAAEHRPVIQERAWTSPIWYQPASADNTSSAKSRAASAATRLL